MEILDELFEAKMSVFEGILFILCAFALGVALTILAMSC